MKNAIQLVTLPLLATSLIAVSLSAVAQPAPKPEQFIKWRQSAFQVIAWNNSRIKANVEGQYNKEDVVKAANTIAAIANGGLGSLFVVGTETGRGWHETTVKPTLFATGSKVGDYATAFARESTELASLAVSSDQAHVKEQFSKLSRTCKTCHDDYKVKD